MKPHLLACVCGLLFAPLVCAEIAKQADGTYLISGPLSYREDKNALFIGANFDKGEYKNVLLSRPEFLDAHPALKNCKKTDVTLKVEARENESAGGKTLIVQKIVEVVKGPEASTAPQ